MSPDVKALLEKVAALPPMSAEEIFEQRVSWAYGQSKGVTKEQVREQLRRERGEPK